MIARRPRFDWRDVRVRYGRWTASGTAWKCACEPPYRTTHGQTERDCRRCRVLRPKPRAS